MYIIFTNAGQAIVGQIFRQSDAPKYLQGMIAVLSLESVAAFLALIGILVFWYSNEKGLGETGLPDLSAEIMLPEERGTESKTPKSTAGTVIIHAPFRYAL
ncbi:hypothetical protein PFICI_02166 [Pestalotiopsis fici W106-1]|uniref:Uncharacterized protein n=1 Tax=Pestalotiopsis fici (strain W106-1 / CGMCC3.15140) TaxID=1229662 RepID=W3XG08_PESFW|nr:uncharacterized protein PFICI_02166 [Pestalotiopsis fici W106-1]ETS84141.1 hypothetical protein PFICI_02166 [Pestalotiopsis fici W106-1]